MFFSFSFPHSNICACVCSQTSFWVVREILHAQTLKIRAEVLSLYIRTAKVHRSYSSAAAPSVDDSSHVPSCRNCATWTISTQSWLSYLRYKVPPSSDSAKHGRWVCFPAFRQNYQQAGVNRCSHTSVTSNRIYLTQQWLRRVSRRVCVGLFQSSVYVNKDVTVQIGDFS